MDNTKLEKLKVMSYEDLIKYCFNELTKKPSSTDLERNDNLREFLEREPELNFLLFDARKYTSKVKFNRLSSILNDYILAGSSYENKAIKSFNEGKKEKDKKPLIHRAYSSNSNRFEKQIRNVNLRVAKYQKKNIDSAILLSNDNRIKNYTKRINNIRLQLSENKKYGTPIPNSNRVAMSHFVYQLDQERLTLFFEIYDDQTINKMIEQSKRISKGDTETDFVEPSDNFSYVETQIDLENTVNNIDISDLDRQIYLLRINGYKGKEIAKILGWQESTVSKHYQKVKSKIKASKCLETT